ncbi:MAG: hypothetical protein GWP61_27680 [Chloroflexi bacterium]|jgi:heterodisulfide reductase subunit A-like polyferredoxin|nr:hypothetical protein [Chloroflexota bacterium]
MTFRETLERTGLNLYLYTHLGLREQDSWVHHDHPDEATEKAVRLKAAGIAKARHIEALDPIGLQAKRHVLVVGMMPNPVTDLIDLFKIAPGKERFLVEVHP